MLGHGTARDIDQVMQTLDDMLPSLQPSAPVKAFEMVEKLEHHIRKGLHERDITEIRLAVLTSNDVLAAAIEQHSSEATKTYKEFIIASCSGGASRGHALVKCFEKDGGRSYEDSFATLQMEQGIDTSTRMASRVYDWAIGKWSCQSRSRASQIEEASYKLRLAVHDAPPLPRHKVYELRRVLLSWPASAGLGVDLWVLQLIGSLPDAALRVFLLIIQLVEAWHFPMQLLIVFVGLIPKPRGGERPMAMTAMLYRLIIKMRRPIIGDWETQNHVF